MSLLRHQADTLPDRVRRASDVRFFPVDEDIPSVLAVRAEEQTRQFRSAGADQSGQTEDLALREVEN